MPALVLAPREGQHLAALGVDIYVKTPAAATGGAVTILEYHAPPRFAGAQPHVHKKMVETFHILRGTLTFNLDGQALAAPPGTAVTVPPGTTHAFSNPTDDPAHFLVTLVPGGMENYFIELFTLVRNAPKWPLPDMTPVQNLARRYDTFPPGQ